MLPDATPKSGISDNQSYHCENRFHQYDHTLQLLFGSVVQVLTNFAVLVSFLSPAYLHVLQYQVSIFTEEDAKFLELLKRVELRPSRADGRSKAFPEVPTIFRVSCGNPASQRRHGPLGLGMLRGLTGNVGRSRAAPCFKIVYFSRIWHGLFTLFCKSWIWVSNWLTVVRIPLLMRRQSINSCLSCSICFFATNSSQLFNFLAICCLIFSEGSISHLQFSTQVYFSPSLRLIGPIDSPVRSLQSLGLELLIDLIKSNIRIPLFQMLNLHICLSFVCNLFWVSQFFSSHGQFSFPFKDCVEILPVSQCLLNVLVSISLPLWHRPEIDLKTTVSRSMSAQVSLMPVRLATESQSANTFVRVVPLEHQFSTKWELCLLPHAGCCLMLRSVEVN